MPTVTYQKTVSDGNVKTILQRIADQLNKDITVYSGDRPSTQTVKGSNSGSLHVAKRAADFHIKGVSDTQGFAFFKANMKKNIRPDRSVLGHSTPTGRRDRMTASAHRAIRAGTEKTHKRLC